MFENHLSKHSEQQFRLNGNVLHYYKPQCLRQRLLIHYNLLPFGTIIIVLDRNS